jgi:hydrogenase/urease accessory protein HupE
MKRVHRLLGACLLSLCAPSSLGHEGRPLHVDIEERDGGLYRVSWRTPASVPTANAPDVVLPDGCTPARGQADARALDRQVLYRCPAGLDGGRITIVYPLFNPSITTLIRFNRRNGERHVAVLSPQVRSWLVPAAETVSGVATEYLALGIRHILGGYDHLLFIACLIFVARLPRRILITITGFTVAHSMTLALSALEWVRLPVPPVEAVIALSIVFVAREIAREQRDTFTWRYPIAVSSSFGLLHGFGFAAVLRDIGLPQIELPTALLFFNLGVEVGQILFVAGLLVLALGGKRILRLSQVGRHRQLEQIVAYGVGCLAVFWTFERLSVFAL